MTGSEWDHVEHEARRYVQSSLNGPDAEAAVRAILAWEWSNPGVSTTRRSSAWSRIVRLAGSIY
jgi:hypothetical protein